MSTKIAILLRINSLKTIPNLHVSRNSLNSITTHFFVKSFSTSSAIERLDFRNPNEYGGESNINYEQNQHTTTTVGYRGHNHNRTDFEYPSNWRSSSHDRGSIREIGQVAEGFHGGNNVGVGQNPRRVLSNSTLEAPKNQNNQSGNFSNGYYRGSSANEFQQHSIQHNGKIDGHYDAGNLQQHSIGYNADHTRELPQNQNPNGFYGNKLHVQNPRSYQREGPVEHHVNANGFYGHSSAESRETVKGHYGGQVQQGAYYSGNTGTSQRNSVDYFSGNNGMSSQGLNSFMPSTPTGMPQQVSSGHHGGNPDGYFRGNGGGYQLNPNGNYNANVGQSQNSQDKNQNGVLHSHVSSSSGPSGESAEATEGSPYNGTIEEFDGFCNEGKVKEAMEVLKLLEQQGTPVNLPRYMVLMNLCGEARALEEAKSVHEHLKRSASPLEISSYNKILEMYGKCESIEDAYKVFNTMPLKNLTSWDTMITGLAKNGRGEEAIELFTQFKKTGLKPDGPMFVGVFSACSVLGDITEGMLHFESMSKDYGIVPLMEHYVSVTDMLGSNGYLDEALEFIEKMPMEPSVDVWETLMTHCRVYGNVELGDRCAELVQLLDPLRLNEQSKAGLIPVKASDLAKEKEKKKLAAQNLLEVRSRVHEYRAGDTSHPEKDRIYTLLRGMREQMKEAGYVAEVKFVLHDIDQEGKEEALLAHSERLAVAHGLLSSPARSPIRIIKNLRVCGDCHSALKIISKLVGRELIIRDAKRFHHFKDGLCSCRDYW